MNSTECLQKPISEHTWNTEISLQTSFFYVFLNSQVYIASGDKSNLSYLLIFCIENKWKWYKFMFSCAAISKENNLGHFQDNNKIRSPWQKLDFFFHRTMESFSLGKTFKIESIHCF